MNALDRFNQSAAEDSQASLVLSKWDEEALIKLEEADKLAAQLEAVLTASCDLSHAGEDALMQMENVRAAIKGAIQDIEQPE